MIRRRTFLGLAATSLLSPFNARAEDTFRFRSITYNVLAFRGYPENDDTRESILSEHPNHPEVTARALAKFNADIITLQEGPPEKLVARFAKELGMYYVWFPGGWEGNDDYPGGFPGAVISRFPIVESENRPSAGESHPESLFTRHLGRAVLETPAGPLHVVTTHLHAQSARARHREVTAILALTRKLWATGPVLVQGDMNHKEDDPEYALWNTGDMVDVNAEADIVETGTFSSVRPRFHIDRFFVPESNKLAAQRAQVINEIPFIPNADDPTSYALSDHLPVMADFVMQPEN